MGVERRFTATATIKIDNEHWRKSIYESLLRYIVCIKGWAPTKVTPKTIKVDLTDVDAKLLISYDGLMKVATVKVSAGDASLVESLLDEIVSFMEAGGHGR